MRIDQRRLINSVNTYSLYGLALFPVVGFALTNSSLVFFLVSSLFLGNKNDSKAEKTLIGICLVFPVILLISTLWDSQWTLGLGKWIKLMPLLLLFGIRLWKGSFITKSVLDSAERLFALGMLIHLLIYLVLLLQFVFFTDQSAILEGKSFFFYSDVVTDMSAWNPRIATDYQKAYLSMAISFAFFVALSRYIFQRSKLYLALSVFFMVALVYFFSIPNVVAVMIILPWWLRSQGLAKNKKVIAGTVAGLLALILVFIGLSYKVGNLDITRDFSDMSKVVFGKEGEEFKSDNPRGIIYSSLLQFLPSVPFFGYGMYDGSEKVKQTVVNSICEDPLQTDCKANRLISSGDISTFSWKSNGVVKCTTGPEMNLKSAKNNCGSHTLFQKVHLKEDGFYTLSIKAKAQNEKFLLRLGDIRSQRASFDFKSRQFLYRGKSISKVTSRPLGDGYYLLGVTTFLTAGDHLALFGFSGSGTDYNHCSAGEEVLIKEPQLEKGEEIQPYRPGLTDIEYGMVTKRVNAHSSFLEYFFAAGYLGFMGYLLWYYGLGRITVLRRYWFGLPLVFLIFINASFEYILIRQWGMSSVFFFLLLIFFGGENEQVDE